MERVAFFIEKTGERIDCLLNPETLEISRQSGVRERRLGGHLVSGRGGADHPLLYTGGGTTELTLNLLFDVALRSPLVTPAVRPVDSARSPEPIEPEIQDVRTLTDRIWKLAEHAVNEQGEGEPTLARIIWGKAWNILGIVTAISERFEGFTGAGVPQRSWIRLLFRRVPDEVVPSQAEPTVIAPSSPPAPAWLDLPAPSELPFPSEEPPTPEGTFEPLYNIASRHGFPAASWRAIAYLSNITHPLRVPVEAQIVLPSGTPTV